MSGVFESGLREKYKHFFHAARSAQTEGLQTLALGKTALALDGEQLGALHKMANLPLVGLEEMRQLAQMASRYLPESLWSTLIISCDGRNSLRGLHQSVAELALPPLGIGSVQEYLQELGMLAVRVPPLPGVLDLLGRHEGIRLFGDGDRLVQPPPGPDRCQMVPVGPIEALIGCMMGDEEFPDDLKFVDGSVRVAVIDSGIDATHPGLKGRVIERFDLGGSGLGSLDVDGHGTHVAGIIAAQWPETRPLWGGVAPFSHLLDIQLWRPLGMTSLDLLTGIGCAMRNSADIINLSLGCEPLPTDGSSLEVMAVEQAVAQGIVVCISAGNSGERGAKSITVPGDAPGALTVAAVDVNGGWAPFSSMGPTENPGNTGQKPTLSAPGVELVSLRSKYSVLPGVDPEGRYVAMSGTSMASPMIAGVCAMGLAALRGKGISSIPPELVGRALIASARDDSEGDADTIGAGVPRVPRFLDTLVRLARQPLHTKSRMSQEDFLTRYRSSLVSVPSKEGPGTIEAPIPPEKSTIGASFPGGTGPVQSASIKGPAVSSEDEFLILAQRYKALEESFVNGVQSNVNLYAKDMAQELTRISHLAAGEWQPATERNRVSTMALEAGIAPGLHAALPINREGVVQILKNGKAPKLVVVVKSFAAAQLIAKRKTGDITTATVSDYLARKRTAFNKVPCVFVLMAPGGWPESVKHSAMSETDQEVLLCEPRNGDDSGVWFELANREHIGWNSWLALTPMTYQRRVEECVRCLLSLPGLQVMSGSARVSEVAARLGVSLTLMKELLPAVCRGDSRFLFHPDVMGSMKIERVKMR